MDGAQVEAEYEHGRLKQIADYCMCDVALTYFIFLECQRMRGLLRSAQPKVCSEAVEFFRAQLATKPFLEELVKAGEQRVSAAQV